MNESIRVVFFDAADTLFHVNGSVAEIYLAHAVQFGFQQSPGSLDAITQAFGRAFRDAPPALFAETDPVKLKDSERLWWFDIVHNVFYRVGMFERFDDFFGEVFKAFESPESWRLFPDTVPSLQDLRNRKIELGIISNFDSRLFSVMRGLGIADLFDTITISSLAKAAKPAQKIFHLALEKHAVDPEEAIHIGDSIRDDVQGATQAGLHAILLDRQGRKTDPQVRSIRSLKEIPEILER
ncbi:Haloacid dehalogenase, subfamily IA [Nitrospira sp. KM1]|uniref:HAD-IA family hydrolase n=1 Tax=Nitrospira sp. KM1 TaxID=1936990 RepID=UPI0013A7AFE9|nr:HAD-IA family hydrolase [Nitrospira sp. KM1]BCA53176.1 Haloacid dehalogenase, subfamily IA [Nitrospira sp. KM1]